eukprot:4784402-Prymnesium_polylepis.2
MPPVPPVTSAVRPREDAPCAALNSLTATGNHFGLGPPQTLRSSSRGHAARLPRRAVPLSHPSLSRVQFPLQRCEERVCVRPCPPRAAPPPAFYIFIHGVVCAPRIVHPGTAPAAPCGGVFACCLQPHQRRSGWGKVAPSPPGCPTRANARECAAKQVPSVSPQHVRLRQSGRHITYQPRPSALHSFIHHQHNVFPQHAIRPFFTQPSISLPSANQSLQQAIRLNETVDPHVRAFKVVSRVVPRTS